MAACNKIPVQVQHIRSRNIVQVYRYVDMCVTHEFSFMEGSTAVTGFGSLIILIIIAFIAVVVLVSTVTLIDLLSVIICKKERKKTKTFLQYFLATLSEFR